MSYASNMLQKPFTQECVGKVQISALKNGQRVQVLLYPWLQFLLRLLACNLRNLAYALCLTKYSLCKNRTPNGYKTTYWKYRKRSHSRHLHLIIVGK